MTAGVRLKRLETQRRLSASALAPSAVTLKLWTTGLPTEDPQLVSQHRDLQFLRPGRPNEQPQESEEVTDSEISKRPQQTPASDP
jgi:hypothetical protein